MILQPAPTPEVQIRGRVRVRVRGRGGVLLPTTSHSIFYSRVDPVVWVRVRVVALALVVLVAALGSGLRVRCMIELGSMH